MPVTRDLPARIRTCTTNLYGSHLGVFDAKPPTRPWVKDSRFWRYSVCEPTKLTPIQTVPLDAPLQGLVPNLLHFFPKERETATIPRNGEIVPMSLNNTFQPLVVVQMCVSDCITDGQNVLTQAI